MLLLMRKSALPAVLLLCWLSASSLAVAADAGVVDNAKLFSSETVRKANEVLAEIKANTNKTVTIETYQGVPADKRDAFRANRDKFYDNWVEARGKALKVHGTLFLVCIETKEDVGANGTPRKHIEAYTDPETRKLFTKDEANLAIQKLGKALGSDANQGLLDAVALTKTSMLKHFADSRPLAKAVENQVKHNNAVVPVNQSEPAPKEGKMDMTTIVIYIVVGLLAFWILIGLVRAFTRPRFQPGAYGAPPPPPGMPMGGNYRGGMAPPPPPGYGQPYGGQPMGYPPQQQAGGMGFMGSLMTGMLGAAAGNFMYDRFFRGDSHRGDYGGSSAGAGGGYFGGGSSSPSEPATGYTTGADFPTDDAAPPAAGGNYDQDIAGGDTNFGGGGEVAGADFDNGGDFGGGGGGDFGGGGDSGGGDFGGGGDSGGGDF